jgi:hypothetical protein
MFLITPNTCSTLARACGLLQFFAFSASLTVLWSDSDGW